MVDQCTNRWIQQWAVRLALVWSLVLVGCTTPVGVRTQGVSGPVDWRTTDFEWHPEAFGEQVYTFTLRLRETQGRDFTFTRVAAVLYNTTDSLPAHWQRTGQWRLPAQGDLAIPLGSRRYCPYPKCWDSGPSLEPIWHLTLSGTDQGGQPVRLVLDLRFPSIPNVVRAY